MDATEPTPSPRELPAPSLRSRLTMAAPAALLWTIGGSLPVLSTIGPSPEYLSAHRLHQGSSLAFVVVLCLVVPMVAVAIALTPTRGWWGKVRSALLIFGTGTLGALAGMAVHRFPGNQWWIQLVLSALGTVIGLWWVYRSSQRPAAPWLGLAPVLALLWFVFATPAGAFIRTGSGAFSAATAIESEDTPVAVLVFDEFPVDVLLNSDLTINAERFPNFARLASISNWFPLATSVSGDTVNSVPALISGQRAVPGKPPISEAYSTNLLHILSPFYDIASREAFTQMCSPDFCKVDGKAPKDPLGGARLLLDDTMLVWKHSVVPPAWTVGLPPITNRFVNFAAEYDSLHATEWAAPAEQHAIVDLIETDNRSDRPMLWFGHFILPHFPYRLSPSGESYMAWKFGTLDSDTRAGEIGRVSERQRLVYQVMAVDAQIGEVLDLLESRGQLDDAAIVVTADHGRNFWKGLNRHPPNDERLVQITSVPLFIKTPGQTNGRTLWSHASTMDIAPTLVAALGVETDARFAGVDLFGGEVPEQRTESYLQTVMKGGKKTYPGYLTPRQSTADLQDLVERMATLLPPDGGVDAVVAIGESGKWVGRQAASLPKSSTSAPTFRDMASIDDPVIQVKVIGPNLPEELIVTRGGVVAGVGLFGAQPEPQSDVVVAVTDERIQPGKKVELWAVFEDGITRMAER